MSVVKKIKTGKNSEQLEKDEFDHSERSSYYKQGRSHALREGRVELSKCLESLVTNKSLADVVFKVGGQRFPCHKCVMSLCGPYFKTMFETELDVSKQEEIEIKEVTSQAMSVIVEYANAQNFEIKEMNVEEVLTASHMFQIEKLVNKCQEFIGRKIDESNCINVYKLATLYNLRQLKRKCLPIIERFFLDLCQTFEFLEMDQIQIGEIIKSDDLHVSSEAQVLDAILQWTEHKVEKRKAFLPSLFKNIRLTLFPSIEELKKFPLLAQSDGCLQMIEEALSYSEVQQIPAGEGAASACSEGSRNLRKGMHNEEIIIYITDSLNALRLRSPVSRYQVLLPGLDSCNKLNNQTLVVTEEDEIFIIGGRLKGGLRIEKETDHISTTYVGNNAAVNLTFRYRKHSDSWVACAPLHVKRYGCLGVALSGYIYALGSMEVRSAVTTSVERYDVSQDNWEYGPPLPQPLEANFKAVAFQGKVYLIMEQAVFCLDPVSNTWSEMPPLPQALPRMSAVVFKGRLHCLGDCLGVYEPRVVMLVFDGSTWEQLWMRIPYRIPGKGSFLIPFPASTDHFNSAVVCQGALFIMLFSSTSSFSRCSDDDFYSLNFFKCLADENHDDLEYMASIDKTEIPSHFLVSKMNPLYMLKVEDKKDDRDVIDLEWFSDDSLHSDDSREYYNNDDYFYVRHNDEGFVMGPDEYFR